MKKIIAIPVFLFALVTFKSFAQSSAGFHKYAKDEKMQMLKAYAHKDLAGYHKHLTEFSAKCNALSDKEKQQYTWYIQQENYLMGDLYALKGDKKNAIVYLKKSDDNDYNDLVKDHDLDNLHKDPAFIKMLAADKNPESKFQVTLQKAPEYNFNEKNNLPQFTYQSADNPNLAALKKMYNLDSIAGQGTDVSKIINLMEWVHYLVPHDGSKGNPETKNAMSLITACKKDGKTLNCRGLAIVLNEVYLAEGYRSRFVTCLPKDTTDNDCHVITMVWCNSLKKWLWMDPTFMAYIMNENGGLLGIEEVRGRLINNKPLILNPDANHNRNEIQTKSDYLGYYMSKNLYRLQCPASSEYNYETPEEGKSRVYVTLAPGSAAPKPHIEKNKHDITSYTEYFTNNPNLFWAQPPADAIAKVTPKTSADYEQVMGKFKDDYNVQDAAGIDNLFADPGEMKSFVSRGAGVWFKEYGKMISYKYVAMDDGDGDPDVALFKMVFDSSVHITGISLDKNDKMETFRLETSSPNIDKLLAKEL